MSRYRRFIGACAVATLLMAGTAPSAQATDRSIAATVARVKPSIVGVGIYRRTASPPAEFRGTGFVVADGLHVLTNAHVLPDNLDEKSLESLAVFVPEGKEQTFRQALRVASDLDHDIALLRIGGSKLPALTIGDSSKVREGDEFAFTGFPIGAVLGLYPVTHRALVSAISPVATPNPGVGRLTAQTIRQLAAGFDVFQLDATAYPGNSGSPLYDPVTAEVIGIVNKVFVQASKENLLDRPSGISYAMPATYAAELIRRAAVRR